MMDFILDNSQYFTIALAGVGGFLIRHFFDYIDKKASDPKHDFYDIVKSVKDEILEEIRNTEK